MLYALRVKTMARSVLHFALSVLVLAIVSAPAQAEPTIDATAALKERVVGDPAAPVTMIEYASLTCPHCASFHNDTYKAFKERFIDTGKVKMIYRDFPLDGIALRAAMMARCTVDQRYFGLIQVLYKSQQQWSRTSDPLAELALRPGHRAPQTVIRWHRQGFRLYWR